MMYHKHLSAARVRAMPWKTQVGLVASELSRASSLNERGGGSEVMGCLQRARELLGVLESLASLPPEAAAALAPVAEELSLPRLGEAPARAGRLYETLMGLYRSV